MSLRIRNWKTHFENAESRKLKHLSWVGVPNKTSGNGYNALIDHPNGAAHLGAWYAIVGACSLREPKDLRGNLPESDGTIGGISRALGRISRLPPELFAEVLPRLIHDPDIQWIEQYGEMSGENPETPGENPETPGANRTGQEGTGGEGKGIEPPKPPASGEALFDEQTIPTSPQQTASSGKSVVRPDVPPNGNGHSPSEEWLKDKHESWYREAYWNHTGKTASQTAYAKRIRTLIHEGASQDNAARFLYDQAVADRQRFEPTEAWTWRRNLHPATWLNQKRWEDEAPPAERSKESSKETEIPTFYKGEFMSHAEYAARKAAGQ